MDLLSIFLKGGWIMYLILACSLIAVAIIIEKFIVLKKAKVNVAAFLVRIRTLLKKKDIDGAIALCIAERTPVSNIVKKGLKKYRHGHQRVVEAIESAGRQEIAKLEKGLPILASISGIAPLLGFLGTVTGMITAFMKIQELQGSANPADLAGGIWEALITTAFGLIVGIPALAFYNYFVSAISKLVMDIELVTTDVIDILEDSGKGAIDDDEEINI
ncbi:MotA/TolQ/ExbB proton channel [Melioribacter roseus P3M-2]|uniref:MotA/TolQ/ExbB proton channel n=1 Tax=Melioribacter roseus (strain DSM 23840 / JCM 17771 / VKM B-2668 / P3M-2) TaxID=1191523 RepID=I6ZT57_MELRP|nr:MotA/TolQ/ExbB proton channel family protein [Melioribacter roseus]AFN75229.1 MotA/TolQ/ExbB proton channel [Melioribacter roseus P3M-2]